jgi:NAD(P)H-dependent flavin oxidoreductase YrpB (nitropropane dioxygenase family)
MLQRCPKRGAAEAAGADVVVGQGMEAGRHRGAFNVEDTACRPIFKTLV